MALAPWCVNEKWEFFQINPAVGGLPQSNPEGCRFARVTGRERAPKSLTANVLWWFQNNYEQQLSEATWYHPEWPQWKRNLYWNYFRNFAQNGNMFVWGVADRNYSVEVVEGYLNPLVIQRNDIVDPATGLPLEGHQRCRLYYFEDGSKDRLWDALSRNPTPTSDGEQSNGGHQPSGLYQIKKNIIKFESWPQPFQDAWRRLHSTPMA